MVLVAVVVVVPLVYDGTMAYGDGDDNHDVCDVQALRVEYKRLVDEHGSKRQLHQMETVHPTKCTCKVWS